MSLKQVKSAILVIVVGQTFSRIFLAFLMSLGTSSDLIYKLSILLSNILTHQSGLECCEIYEDLHP